MEGLFVDRDYVMNPEFDEVLFSGTDLRVGMVVLIEDALMREGSFDRSSYSEARRREANRWCTVERIEVRPRPEHGSALVKFLAAYADGTKCLRSYDASYGWLVKKDSVAPSTFGGA